MKKITFLITIALSIFFISCEEVVNLDLDTAAPRLVVEAPLQWQKGTLGNKQYIKLTTTTGYYNQTIPEVSGATVFITNSSDIRFDFIEITNSGKYVCENFLPVLNETYVLTIVNNGQTYMATEKLNSVAPITQLEQIEDGGIAGNQIQVKAYFDDPPNQSNFYLYNYIYSNKINSFYNVSEDTFYQGNEFFSSSRNDDLQIGDKLTITHLGISQEYYNYMTVLIGVATGGSNGPFQTPPATVRGNIINKTNEQNYALGYFSVSESDTKNYIIQ